MRRSGAESIVAENRERKPVLAKRIPQDSPRRSHGLIRSATQGNGKTRMIIDDRKGIDPRARDLNRPFEIALPKIVRRWPLEELNRLAMRIARLDAAISGKDIGDCSDRRHAESWITSKQRADLARAPAMAVANLQHTGFKVRSRTIRRMFGTPRKVAKRRLWVTTRAIQPFVAGFSTDAKQAAGRRDRDMENLDLMNKSKANFRHGSPFPRHKLPPFEGVSMPKKCYLCLFNECNPCECTQQRQYADQCERK